MSQSRREKMQLLILSRLSLLTVMKSGYLPALTVLFVLYETWFLDWEHKNPVRLTSESLRAYGISRGQKNRSLKILEEYGAVTVDRKLRKNPVVTLNWRLPFVKRTHPSQI